jgi:hypothetical protein
MMAVELHSVRPPSMRTIGTEPNGSAPLAWRARNSANLSSLFSASAQTLFIISHGDRCQQPPVHPNHHHLVIKSPDHQIMKIIKSSSHQIMTRLTIIRSSDHQIIRSSDHQIIMIITSIIISIIGEVCMVRRTARLPP